jgi:peptidoglycan/xylan/chitin deacetylase (PgdA/CDA1 family)
MDRRLLLSLLSIGAAEVLAGCASDGHSRATARPASTTDGGPPATSSPTGTSSAVAPGSPDATAEAGPLPPIPPPHPGPPSVVSRDPGQGKRIALTIDDGYDPEVVAGYVAFAQRSKIPISFSPNGCYQSIWNRHAEALRPLIEAGQVQIGNHTFTHKSLVDHRTDADIRADVEKNEEWIEKTFGITSRPFFRPPYGFRNEHTDGVVAGLGYTKVLLWNGSFGDSTLITPDQLLGLARQYLQPGTIMIGHANHKTVLGLFGDIQNLIEQRQLEPVTLDTMFGTSRAVG